MIVTKDNINSIEFVGIDNLERSRGLLCSLLDDIDEFNELVGHPSTEKSFVWDPSWLYKICITWQDWHDEYSPESLECPDYYGLFRICLLPDNSESPVPFSEHLTLDELDSHLCTLVSYFSDSKEYRDTEIKKRADESKRRSEESQKRKEAARSKYASYIPKVGDICMPISTENSFYRYTCSISVAIITSIEGDLIKLTYFKKDGTLMNCESPTSFRVDSSARASYHSADLNDAFAKADNVKGQFGAFLVSKWMGIELIDEFNENYVTKAGAKPSPNRFFWKHYKPSRVDGTTINKHLARIREILVGHQNKDE